METMVELRGLTSTGWFEELTSSLPATTGVGPGDLSELAPAPGTFGASRTAKLKAHLQTIAQLAGVLSAAVTLYHAGFGGDVKSCKLTFSDGTTNVALVVPCEAAQSPAFAKSIEDVLAKLEKAPSSVTIDPVDASRT